MVNKEFWKSALADVWYLLVILVAIGLVVAYKVATGGDGASQGDAQPAGVAADSQAQGADPVPQPRQTAEEKARAIIADYKKRLDAEPQGQDAPALLAAMGNLTMQKLGDHKEAARLYEVLLHDYPNWEMIARVYPQLMTCYEQLENKDGLRWLYKQMMEKFPPDSQQYLYAQAHLND